MTTPTTPSITDDQINIRDYRGASLVIERWDDGRLTAWIAPPGENDGQSVAISDEALGQLAGFLGLRRVEPAVDHEGNQVWLTEGRYVERLCDDEPEPPPAVRRLYVEPHRAGDAS